MVVKPTQILKGREATVFYAARDILKEHRYTNFLLFAQTSLGELFETTETQDEADKKLAYKAYNSRRSDIVITNNYGYPALMIEYQGKGHTQKQYYLRDEIKRRVFQKAGVRFLELPENLSKEEIFARIRENLDGIIGVTTSKLTQESVNT